MRCSLQDATRWRQWRRLGEGGDGRPLVSCFALHCVHTDDLLAFAAHSMRSELQCSMARCSAVRYTSQRASGHWRACAGKLNGRRGVGRTAHAAAGHVGRACGPEFETRMWPENADLRLLSSLALCRGGGIMTRVD